MSASRQLRRCTLVALLTGAAGLLSCREAAPPGPADGAAASRIGASAAALSPEGCALADPSQPPSRWTRKQVAAMKRGDSVTVNFVTCTDPEAGDQPVTQISFIEGRNLGFYYHHPAGSNDGRTLVFSNIQGADPATLTYLAVDLDTRRMTKLTPTGKCNSGMVVNDLLYVACGPDPATGTYARVRRFPLDGGEPEDVHAGAILELQAVSHGEEAIITTERGAVPAPDSQTFYVPLSGAPPILLGTNVPPVRDQHFKFSPATPRLFDFQAYNPDPSPDPVKMGKLLSSGEYVVKTLEDDEENRPGAKVGFLHPFWNEKGDLVSDQASDIAAYLSTWRVPADTSPFFPYRSPTQRFASAPDNLAGYDLFSVHHAPTTTEGWLLGDGFCGCPDRSATDVFTWGTPFIRLLRIMPDGFQLVPIARIRGGYGYDCATRSVTALGTIAEPNVQLLEDGATVSFRDAFDFLGDPSRVINVFVTTLSPELRTEIEETAALENRAPLIAADGIDGAGVLTGWAYDPDTPRRSLEIHLYAGGGAGQGEPFAITTTGELREDVGDRYNIQGLHGFRYPIPAEHLGKPIYAYAIDSSGVGENPGVGPLYAPARPPR